MTTAKLLDNNRRSHAAKVLAQASKKNQNHNEESSVEENSTTEVETESTSTFSALNEQYGVIREDILKLREDLAQGYDLLKDYIESKVSLRSLIRAK